MVDPANNPNQTESTPGTARRIIRRGGKSFRETIDFVAARVLPNHGQDDILAVAQSAYAALREAAGNPVKEYEHQREFVSIHQERRRGSSGVHREVIDLSVSDDRHTMLRLERSRSDRPWYPTDAWTYFLTRFTFDQTGCHEVPST